MNLRFWKFLLSKAQQSLLLLLRILSGVVCVKFWKCFWMNFDAAIVQYCFLVIGRFWWYISLTTDLFEFLLRLLLDFYDANAFNEALVVFRSESLTVAINTGFGFKIKNSENLCFVENSILFNIKWCVWIFVRWGDEASLNCAISVQSREKFS